MVNLTRLLTLLFFVTLAADVTGQNYLNFDNSLSNQYLFNPAESGTNRTRFTALYRMQWIGIQGAPAISTLGGAIMLKNPKLGLSFRVSNNKRGFLNSSDGQVAVSYSVPLNIRTNLNFGMSAGFLANQIDFVKLGSDAADPALANLRNAAIPAASMGVSLRTQAGIQIGVIIPQFIRSETLDNTFLFSGTRNVILTAGFSSWNPSKKVRSFNHRRSRLKGTGSVPLEYLALVRLGEAGTQAEILTRYNFSSGFSGSVGYRTGIGFFPGIGFNQDNLKFSYFYEPGFGGKIPFATHEVSVSVMIGKERKKSAPPAHVSPTQGLKPAAQNNEVKKLKSTAKAAPLKPKPVGKGVITSPVEKTQTPVAQPVTQPVVKNEPPVIQQPKKDTIVTPPPVADRSKPAPNEPSAMPDQDMIQRASKGDTIGVYKQERNKLDAFLAENAFGTHDDPHEFLTNTREEVRKQGKGADELELSSYVIAGAFISRANAEHFTNELRKMGFTANFGHLSLLKIWYVYISKQSEVSASKLDRDELKQNKIFKHVWVLTVQE
jgi:type IX secretion system PorP/SprF family membrane protein